MSENPGFLNGGGSMGKLTREFDWAKSALGLPNEWPGALRHAVSNMLQTKFPMLVLWGEDFTCFYNDAFLPSLGKDGHPALAKRAQDVWSDGWDFVGTQLNKVLHSGEPVTFDDQPVAIHRDGVTRDIFWTFCYSPILGDNGKAAGVLVTCMETSARENRVYETVISVTPDLVYVFDLNYRFLYANHALLTMWGKTWDTAIGKGLRENGYEEWHAAMHEREIDQVAATGKSVRGEVAFPHAVLGRRVYDYILVPVFDEMGKVEAVAGTTRDISDIQQAALKIRESEERFRTMAEGSSFYIAVGDESGNAIYFNNTWTELTGRPMKELMEYGWVDFVHPDDKDRYVNIYLDAFKIKAPFTGELRVRNPTGEYRWLLANGAPRFDADGVFAGYVSACADITRQKQTELELRELQLDLENLVQVRTEELQATNEELSTTNEELSESSELLMQSNEELSQFAYVASHDLQEPVRKISVFAEMLEKSAPNLDERSKNYLNKIDESANRMLILIRDILTHSQISRKGSTFVSVDLNQILASTLSSFELLIQENQCVIKHDTLPVIDAIEVQMSQLFSNLISNALKFATHGKSLCLEIRSKKLSDAERSIYSNLSAKKTYWEISFIDNGIGFDQSYATQIFEIFQRLHTKQEYSGTGIGLATCKKIVQNHGGDIKALSVKGEGARFNVVLPALQ